MRLFIPVGNKLEEQVAFLAVDRRVAKAECNAEQKLIIDFVDETACRIMEAVRFAHEDIDGELITL